MKTCGRGNNGDDVHFFFFFGRVEKNKTKQRKRIEERSVV